MMLLKVMRNLWPNHVVAGVPVWRLWLKLGSFPRLLSFLLCTVCAFSEERRFDFSEFRENESPTGFRSAVTGRGPAGNWKVITAEVPPLVVPLSTKTPVVMKRGVLAQLSNDRDDTRAPLFIWDVEPFHDFTFTTRFKILSGEVEQMAGVAFRLQDEKNYYYVRANAKDQNVAFFRYVDGELIGGVSVPAAVKKDDWNQLAVECKGTRLRALLNEREVVPWTEPNLVPFPDGTSKGVFPSGKIAFWTKADSVVYFTDAHVEFAPREMFAQTLLRETMAAHPRLVNLKIFGLITNQNGTKIVASSDEKDIGQPGDEVRKAASRKGALTWGKARRSCS